MAPFLIFAVVSLVFAVRTGHWAFPLIGTACAVVHGLTSSHAAPWVYATVMTVIIWAVWVAVRARPSRPRALGGQGSGRSFDSASSRAR